MMHPPRTTYRPIMAVLCCVLLWPATSWAWHSIQTGGRCKQSGGTCRTTIGNAGGQGACCDPRQSGLATCASSNACQGGNPYKWMNLPVKWSLNLNNMPGKDGYAGKTGSSIEAALKQAWDAWTKPTCTGFSHSYQGQTTTKASTSDRKLVNFLASTGEWAGMGLPSSVLAVTRPVAPSSGALYDADIVYNPRPSGRAWGIYPNVKGNEMDFADVAAHEIGHALGFGHTAPRSSLMYYAVRGVGPIFNGLTSDEESGICTIYPVQKCTSDSQCGTCRACTNGTCGPKNLTPPASVCKGCKSDANCQGSTCASIGGVSRCLQACDAAGCCPSGTTCKTLSGKQLCVPSGDKCPDATCTNNNECGTGEACRNQVCTKACQQDTDCEAGKVCQNQACVPAQPGKLGQPCSTNIPCVSGTTCQQTSKGQICTVPCGAGTGGFSPGAAGSSCTACAGGTTCANIAGRIPACIVSCSSSTACQAAGGGRCIGINGTRLCYCTKDSDCSSGYGCNTSVIGRIRINGAPMGACAKRGGGTCPTGYQCSTNFCVPGGTGNTCGNGQCDGSENCGTCAQDCKCSNGQTCQNNACVTPATCGNGTCDGSENCGTCAQDCPCANGESCQNNQCKAMTATCGDGVCNGNENCGTCADECGCPAGFSCQNNACKPLDNCGNGVCEAGENCDSCEQDCACQGSMVCLSGTCQDLSGDGGPPTPDTTTNPPTPDQNTSYDTTIQPTPGSLGGPCRPDNSCDGNAVCIQQTDGTKKCLTPSTPSRPRTGCQCQQTNSPITPAFLFLLALAFLLRKRHQQKS